MDSIKEIKPILQLNQVSKSFPGVKALQHVDFALYPGEVHILAGENGAGKSTLTKCMLGIYQPEEGEIIYQGQKVHFQNARDAIQNGIAAVYQELTMIPYLNAAQNICFQKEPTYGPTPLIRSAKMYEDAREILSRLHCEDMDLTVPVSTLSVASQQMIEIAKALSLQPKLIIFDEPTTSLTSDEVKFLFEQIQSLKRRGIAILFISHRMNEIREIGDKITILRDGKWISTDLMDEISDDEIIHRMIGRNLKTVFGETTFSEQNKKRTLEKTQDDSDCKNGGQLILEAKDLCDKVGRIHECSFCMYEGEIVGFAGLVGSGRTELANLLYGIDPLSSGKIIFHGKTYRKIRTEEITRNGMGFLPEDRKGLGLAVHAPIHWNVLAGSLKKHFPRVLLSEKKSIRISDQYVEQLRIATPDSVRAVEELSGGNQQKVVLAKWFSADADLLVFDEPTRGIDIGAKREIYQLLRTLASEGKSLLFISSEMEELMGICDRIYCLNEGRITGEFSREEFSERSIGEKILSDTENISDRTKPESIHSGENEKKEKRIWHSLKTRTKKRKSIAGLLPPAFYMCLLLILLFGCKADHYFTFHNLSSVLSQSAALMVLACGQAWIVLIQGTDLSLGSLVSLIGVLWLYLLNHNVPMYLSVFLCILCGAVCGLLNGLIVARGKIPIFIVTLGTQNIFKSIALLLCGSQTLYYSSNIFQTLAKERLFGLTYIVWIAVICFAFSIFMCNCTTFGMRARGLGGNPQSMQFSGGNIEKSQIKIFLYAGIAAAISGLILCCRIESGNPNAGSGMEFNSIAAVLLGGISMREGKGNMGGIVFGVLLIQILKSGLTQIGMNSTYQNATIGIVVLFAIIMDVILKKAEEEKMGGRAQ